MRAILSALAALALAAAPLHGQLLHLEVVEAATGGGVPGVLVGIIDARGQVVVRTVTSSTGRRAIALPGPGAYRVHVRRIGHEPYTSPAVTLATGDTVPFVVHLPARPVMLPAVRSSGAAQCDLRDGASNEERVRVFTLWEQLRTALALTELAHHDVAALGNEAEGASGEVLQYVTRLAPDRQTVLRHTVRPARPAQPRPFATFTPAELSARGYVRHEPSGIVVAAPDERVLLSSEFAAEHCFRLVPGEGERAGMVGIAFTPARGRERDIAGVLWADSATLRLRLLDFWYEDDALPRAARGAGRAGGQAHFAQLASGAWAVTAWRLRAPQVSRPRDGRVVNRRLVGLVGYIEVGALARPADARDRDNTGALAEYVARVRPGALAVTAFDSITMRPLPGARVELQQQADSAAALFEGPVDGGRPREAARLAADTVVTADAEGRVRVTGLPAGRYTVRAAHLTLDSLALAVPPSVVRIAPDSASDVTLATPSFASLWTSCGSVPHDEARVSRDEGGGIVLGVVRDGAGRPLPRARVTVTWRSSDGAFDARHHTAAARADEAGAYRICGLPSGRTLTVWAEWRQQTSRRTTVQLGDRRVVGRALVIDEDRG